MTAAGIIVGREVGLVALLAVILSVHSIMSRWIGGWYLGWRGIAAWILPVSVNLAFREIGLGELSILPSMAIVMGWIFLSMRSDPRGAPDRSPFIPSVAELMNGRDRGVAVTYLVRSRWCDSEEIAARSPEIAAEKFAIMRWRSVDPIDMLALVEVEEGARSWLVRVSSAPMPRVDARVLWSSAASPPGVA